VFSESLNKTHSHEIKIPSDTACIRQVSRKIEDFLKAKTEDSSVLFDIRLSVEEAVKNAIIHGNKRKKNLSVSVRYSFREGAFSVEIEDAGSGFALGKIADPTKGDNILMEGGRGVFLMHKLMDKVLYNKNRVSMIKLLKSQKGGKNADNKGK